MRCTDCDTGLACCHAPSILHVDGTSECLGEVPCALGHDLHAHAVTCDEVGCACRYEEVPLPLAA